MKPSEPMPNGFETDDQGIADRAAFRDHMQKQMIWRHMEDIFLAGLAQGRKRSKPIVIAAIENEVFSVERLEEMLASPSEVKDNYPSYWGLIRQLVATLRKYENAELRTDADRWREQNQIKAYADHHSTADRDMRDRFGIAKCERCSKLVSGGMSLDAGFRSVCQRCAVGPNIILDGVDIGSNEYCGDQTTSAIRDSGPSGSVADNCDKPIIIK